MGDPIGYNSKNTKSAGRVTDNFDAMFDLQKKIKDESFMKQRTERIKEQLEMIKVKTAEAKCNAKTAIHEKVVDIKDFMKEKEQNLVKKAQFWKE